MKKAEPTSPWNCHSSADTWQPVTGTLAEKAMKPTNNWLADWIYGEKPRHEEKTAEELIKIFEDFWDWAKLESKSKTTKQRYSAALHALVGYLVEEAGNGFRANKGIREFLEEFIDSEGGPLIYHHDELWQNELDAVCRKLYKYLVAY